MPSNAGVSIRGNQTIFMDVVVAPSRFSIVFLPRVKPPVQRVGYYFISYVESTNPSGVFVIQTGRVYNTGIYDLLTQVPPLGGNLMRVDVDWNINALSWTFAVI